jgi:predicted dehydrogenase
LIVKIPDSVPYEEAAFGVLGSIGLQGIRLAAPTLGERFAVFGMGLIGLLTVQLLNSHGCRVLGIDIDPERLAIAEGFGAETCNVMDGADPIAAMKEWTGGRGVDGALITASAKTDEIVHQAAESCRKRGRIVLVGVVGLNLRRSDFYEKELTFQVSCSYGPGRYDEKYEKGGTDYPYGFVRWTEQRNFEAVLEMMALGRVNVKPLVSYRFSFDNAVRAYDIVQSVQHCLGVVLEYQELVESSPKVVLSGRRAKSREKAAGESVVGVIGAGNFAKAILLPALRRAGARVKYIASQGGVSAAHAAQRFGAENAVTDYGQILEDDEVEGVLICVQHNMHARIVQEAIAQGKHVFVEKPLAMNERELDSIAEELNVKRRASSRAVPEIMVGFNRRYSPHVDRMKQLLMSRCGPLCMSMTVNAGEIAHDHWVQDPERGGGRIVGEACHFIDLLAHIADSNITSVAAIMVGEGPVVRSDKMSMLLSFADGSVGTVNYFANGSKKYPKEGLEVFSDGRVLRMDNYRVMRGYGFKGFRVFRTLRQDKGYNAEMAAFVGALRGGGESMIPFDRLANVTLASFAAMRSAAESCIVCL